MKIYTKTGDKGTTALIGGQRVPKYDSRVEAYGTADELTSVLGCLYDGLNGDELDDLHGDVADIMSDLMYVQALLAGSENSGRTLGGFGPQNVERLERRIDEMCASVPPLGSFTIPCGHPLVSLANVCRTVCRRAERRAIQASAEHGIPEQALIYLNRLSDYLYSVTRVLATRLGVEEIVWKP